MLVLNTIDLVVYLPFDIDSGCHYLAMMHVGVARTAKCYQVLFAICARLATKLFVMDLKVRHRSARLASPSIAAKDLIAQLFV